jgi:hypothetical protein
VIDPEELGLGDLGLYAPALIPEVREECGDPDVSSASGAEPRGCGLFALCLFICLTLWGLSTLWVILAEILR